MITNPDIDTTKLSSMYFAKHFINHHKSNISTTKYEIGFKVFIYNPDI